MLHGHDDLIETAAYSFDGNRIVTASDDKTARIWDARVPAGLSAQIAWATAAQADQLSDIDQLQLGPRRDSRAKWTPSPCDAAAGAFYDPDRSAPGVAQIQVNADIANAACSAETAMHDSSARSSYQLGRASLAKNDPNAARHYFELAVSRGYRAAGLDLGDLLLNTSAGMRDARRAASLYEQAWRDGVPFAAFELGHLYEAGAADAAPMAWSWYQKGADAGEPSALARLAERDDRNAVTETDPSKRGALLLHAFLLYAAAAERAKQDDWPEDAWRNWRYRRATLARLLAREGMMQQVADAYASVRGR